MATVTATATAAVTATVNATVTATVNGGPGPGPAAQGRVLLGGTRARTGYPSRATRIQVG